MVFKRFLIHTLLLSSLPIITPQDGKDPKAEAERAEKFAKEYMEVIGHEKNAKWDLHRDQHCTKIVKHGESEECSGSISTKPLCNVCSHAIKKTFSYFQAKARPETASFFRGNLKFPHADFEVKQKVVDVIKCTHSPEVAGKTYFYLTRSKYPESAYFLNSAESDDKKTDPTFTLSGKYASWYNEDLNNENFNIELL